MKASSEQAIAEQVRRLRREVIIGQTIDMVPYDEKYDAEVARLRGLPEVIYFMNLERVPTIENQKNWRIGYEQRKDDIMWVIKNKAGQACGTNRIYNLTSNECEKGSLIADPKFTKMLPITLESELIIIDHAFNNFNIERVLTHVRSENVNMNSINSRFGFTEDGEVVIRGVKYSRFQLRRESWKPTALRMIVRHWAMRATKMK